MLIVTVPPDSEIVASNSLSNVPFVAWLKASTLVVSSSSPMVPSVTSIVTVSVPTAVVMLAPPAILRVSVVVLAVVEPESPVKVSYRFWSG